jgi:ATP-dependent DNA helicase PIF1
MVQRQQVFPWQNIGLHADAAPTAPASARVRTENQSKRQRESVGLHPQPRKRHHPSASRSPVGSRKQPVEVIDLLDDDDGPPSLLINAGQRATVYEQQPVRYPPLPNIGSQGNPLDLDSPPRYPQITGAVDPASHFQELVKSFNNTAALQDNSAADIVPIVEPTLCKEQADLVDLILSGRNVFYTGSAGCGKSTVLKAFVKRFAERGMKVNIIAPTGRAALDINGSTTWTYAGWTPDHHKKPLEKLRAGAHGKFVHKRLNETDVLVIDEISMVENHHFERINHLMKEARNKESAFGGVQIVVTGDFCQLPPVKPFRYCIDCGRETIKNNDETEYKCRVHGTFYDKDKWAFRSTAWQESDFVHVNLTQIHRQSDRAFIGILNKLRMGIRLLPVETELLLNHESETRNAIQLFATRAEVNKVNEERFRALRSVERTYKCLDHFRWNDAHGNLKSKGEYKAPDGSLQALAEHRFESLIRLKKGMLVVLLHNLDIGAGLVNGSQGTIQGFEDYDPKNLPKSATSREKRDALPTQGVQVLQGDHAVFREWQLQEYAKQMDFKAWPVVR